MATFTATKGNNKATKNSYVVVVVNLYRTLMFATVFSLFCSLTSCSPNSEIINPENVSGVNYMLRANAVVDSSNSLKSVATFPIGAAFSSNIVLNSAKAYDTFLGQFDSKTVYTFMRVEPARGRFNFKEMDYWVALSQKSPMRLHGHCLVYHNGTPDWLTNFSGSTADFEQAIKNHIQTIVGRYKGKVQGWDVINEVYDNAGIVKPTTFRKLYASDEAYIAFIKRCYEWAHDADPNATLFYSDFGMEVSKVKLKTVLNMLSNFKRSGVPVAGVSPHMHISINTSDSRISDCLRQLSATGMQVHISELDIKINPDKTKNLVITDRLLDAQRVKFRTVAMAYKQVVPKNQQYGITLWDFSDADSWIVKSQEDAPCIFNANYDKKPAYYGLMEGLMN